MPLRVDAPTARPPQLIQKTPDRFVLLLCAPMEKVAPVL